MHETEEEEEFKGWLARSSRDRRNGYPMNGSSVLKFDKTINLGHILTLVTMLIMFGAFFNKLDSRLTAVETNIAWIVRNLK